MASVIWLIVVRRLAHEMRALVLVPHSLRPASDVVLPPLVERYRHRGGTCSDLRTVSGP